MTDPELTMFEIYNDKIFNNKYLLENESILRVEMKIVQELTRYIWIPLKTLLIENYNHHPYHNFTHALMVTGSAIDIYREEVRIGNIEFDQQEFCNLILASLFHDINHSGGEFEDSVNIENAIGTAWIAMQGMGEILHLEEQDHKDIASAIKDTTFTDGHFNEATSKIGEILRDADIISSFEHSNCPSIMKGLKDEMAVTMPKYREINDLTFLALNFDFLSNLKYYTDYGKTKSYQYLSKLSEKLDKHGMISK